MSILSTLSSPDQERVRELWISQIFNEASLSESEEIKERVKK